MIKINLEELKKFYLEDGKTLSDLSKYYNCCTDTIKNKLKSLGIYKSPIDKTELKEKIKLLYSNGSTCKEIGEIVNLSEKTIAYHLKQMNIKTRSKKKIDQKIFEKLWNDGKSDEEIAEYFGVTVLTIRSFRTRGENAGKFSRLNYFSDKNIPLSDIQEQFILGSLLGDLAINLTGQMKNAKLCLVHSIKQEELFMSKVKLLDIFMGSYKLYTPNPDKRTGKIYQTWRGNSKSHKYFTEIYKLLYSNGVKTITKEYLDKIHNPIALAYWFMDDGTYRGTIATNCFSKEEVQLLSDWMYNYWNIETTLQSNENNVILYIKSSSRLKFEKLIFPYMIPSMYYKLKNPIELLAESV